MSNPLVWLPAALKDIDRLYKFLREKSPSAAMRAAQTIFEGARLLESTPEAVRPLNDDTARRELFLAFSAGAYVLRYKWDVARTVVIIRVWRSRENRD